MNKTTNNERPTPVAYTQGEITIKLSFLAKEESADIKRTIESCLTHHNGPCRDLHLKVSNLEFDRFEPALLDESVSSYKMSLECWKGDQKDRLNQINAKYKKTQIKEIIFDDFIREISPEVRLKNVVGEDKGKLFREKYNLDQLDKDDQQVRIIFPDDIVLLSHSFIKGAFTKSAKNYKSHRDFVEKYKFHGNLNILSAIVHFTDDFYKDRDG